jgi:hypothetical protein
VPFILFIDSVSLFNHFLFLYLKCNILTSCWCCNFYLCLHPINLIFFFRSWLQDYQKLFLSSIVLGTKELNIGYNNAMSCYFNRKGNLSSAYGNNECNYWLQFFSFQIRSSKVVPVHHSSFGLSTHILVCISFCEWCVTLHSHTCLKVTYQVFMEIMRAAIDFYFFLFRLERCSVFRLML